MSAHQMTQGQGLDQRRFFSRKPGNNAALRQAKLLRPETRTTSYFELLMSLPAQKTLPELLQAS